MAAACEFAPIWCQMGIPLRGPPAPSRGLPRVTDACSANGDCRGQRASCIIARAMSLVLVTIAL